MAEYKRGDRWWFDTGRPIQNPHTGEQKRLRGSAVSRGKPNTRPGARKAQLDAVAEFLAKRVTERRGSSQTLPDIEEPWLDYCRDHHGQREHTRTEKRKRAKRWIYPQLGQVALHDFDWERVRDFQQWLTRQRKPNGEELSRSYQLSIMRELYTMLDAAWHLRLTPSRIDRVKTKRQAVTRNPEFWTVAETEALIKANRTEDIYPALLVALRTGLRPGELFALQWTHVDFDRREVSVEFTATGPRLGPPKTLSSVRRVPLPPDALRALRELRLRSSVIEVSAAWCAQARQSLAALGLSQTDLAYRIGTAPGQVWQILQGRRRSSVHVPAICRELGLPEPTRDRRFVFGPGGDSPWHPQPASIALRLACERAAVRALTWHKCRHTYATHLLALGTPPRQVSAYLGHRLLHTLEVYGHAIPEGSERWADRLGSGG